MIAAIEALSKASTAQRQADGKAKAATALRDDSYELFRTWIRELKATARVALRKRPGLLEKLGL